MLVGIGVGELESETQRKAKRYASIGKDEMNLLEYCIFSASNRVDRKTKSLQFEDPVFCNIERRQLVRKLTVAFSAEYGRPTARDDLVLVALMKKSREEGFNSQRVHFTRYELLKILNWPENGQSYERIDQALNRIIGTHLVWENAFWDNEAKSWVDRKFSIIDDVHLYDRDKYDRARKRDGEPRPQSWFKWSDVMFDSFQAGYIKSIDLELLNGLRENVAKRLYRWLDKHFNNPKRKMPIEIPIADLTGRKLGFQKAPASHLQRMLAPAIEELESISYLAPEAARFSGKGRDCVIRFRPVRKATRISEQNPQKPLSENPLAAALEAKGISQLAAERWARQEPEQAKLQLEHLEWLLATGWKPEKGEGAWLNAAIRGQFQPPVGFQTKAEKSRERREVAVKRMERERKQNAHNKARRRSESSRRERIAEYLKKLTSEQREAVQNEALANGDAFICDRLRQAEASGEQQMIAIYREKLVSDYIQSKLQKDAASE